MPKFKTKELTREEAEELILDTEYENMKSMAFNSDFSYFNDIMTSGFKGYVNFTDKELEDELYEQVGMKNNTKYKIKK